jgi:hypothetical protein
VAAFRPPDAGAGRGGTRLVSATSGHYHNIYVASSWRNDIYPTVVETLRAHSHSVYDFRQPNGHACGFNFRNAGLDGDPSTGDLAAASYLDALDHPAAIHTFGSHFEAMLSADTVVLVLPCGRSAHTELGWAVGAHKRTAILLDDPCTPELMYRLADKIVTSLDELVEWLADPGDDLELFAPDRIFASALNRVRQRNGATR